MHPAVRGLIAGVVGFAVGGALNGLLQGMSAPVRAMSCGATGAIVVLAVITMLPGRGGGPGETDAS